MSDLLMALAAVVWLAFVARAALVAARIFQIEEYETPRLLAWARQRAWLWPRATLAGAGLALLGGLILALAARLGQGGIALGWLAGGAALHALWRGLPAKKALVYTPRVRRMLGAAALLAGLAAAGLAALALALPAVLGALLVALLCVAAPGLAVGAVAAGNAVMAPVEARVRQGFLRRAGARLRAVAPLTVGVAGSYGKTSTKHIIAQLAAPQIETLATPKSFNTLMGISRAINENLEERHRLFVVEMDAYGPGEIARICRLVEPRIGVITAVGPQHLERFGTPEAIAAALYELVAALPAGAPAVIYSGDEASARLAAHAAAQGYAVTRYGLEDGHAHGTSNGHSGHGTGNGDGAGAGNALGNGHRGKRGGNGERVGDGAAPLDVTARAVRVDAAGGVTRFCWEWPARGLRHEVAIPLLGRHNILNVSAALAVIALAGLDVAAAVAAAARLEPAPHRLQLLPNAGGITIIDDSYNANPVGLHNGLDVLEYMSGRAKILVTPGLVELGPIEEAENGAVGRHAARVCDHVILVGARQTRPIYAGLREGGLPDGRIHVVETLAQVTATLGRIGGRGDVVLFANDLPDSYLEMT